MRSLLATGAQRSENCGFSRSARPNQCAPAAPVAEAALDHPAMEDLERVERPEPKRALRVAQRLAAVPVPLERPSQDVVAVDRRPLALRAARASASEAGSRIPWSTSKSAVSRSVLTPFATSSRSMTRDQRVLLAAPAVVWPRHAVEVAEHRDVLRQRDPVDGRLLGARSRRARRPCAHCAQRERVVARARSRGTRAARSLASAAASAYRPTEK